MVVPVVVVVVVVVVVIVIDGESSKLCEIQDCDESIIEYAHVLDRGRSTMNLENSV